MTDIKTWIKENSKYLFIVFAFLVFLSTFTSLDQDLYWHIKNGESLLKHGISNKDYFSYWGGNYIAHEWLYDIFLFFLNQIDGLRLIKLVSFILIGSSLFMSMKIAENKNKNNLGVYLIPIIIWATARILLEARPQIISLFFFCLTFYVLETKKSLWWLPIISLLTVNFHGSIASLIFAVPIIYFISYIFDEEVIDIKYLKKLGLMIVLMGISLGLTPFGFNSVTYGLSLPKWILDTIAEWQVIIKSSKDIWLLFLLLVPLASMAYTRKAKLKEVLFISMMLMLTFIHLRSALLLVPVYIMFASSHIDETLKSVFERINLPKINLKIKLDVNIFLVVMIAIFVFNVFNINFENIEKTSKSSPVIITNYIEENNIDVKNNIMFNNYGYGGYFIYHNYPVFIDGRTDVYLAEYGNEPIYNDYYDMWQAKNNTKDLISKYNIKYWSISPNENLYKYLLENEIATVLVEDNNFAFLETVEKEDLTND